MGGVVVEVSIACPKEKEEILRKKRELQFKQNSA